MRFGTLLVTIVVTACVLTEINCITNKEFVDFIKQYGKDDASTNDFNDVDDIINLHGDVDDDLDIGYLLTKLDIAGVVQTFGNPKSYGFGDSESSNDDEEDSELVELPNDSDELDSSDDSEEFDDVPPEDFEEFDEESSDLKESAEEPESNGFDDLGYDDFGADESDGDELDTPDNGDADEDVGNLIKKLDIDDTDNIEDYKPKKPNLQWGRRKGRSRGWGRRRSRRKSRSRSARRSSRRSSRKYRRSRSSQRQTRRYRRTSQRRQYRRSQTRRYRRTSQRRQYRRSQTRRYRRTSQRRQYRRSQTRRYRRTSQRRQYRRHQGHHHQGHRCPIEKQCNCNNGQCKCCFDKVIKTNRQKFTVNVCINVGHTTNQKGLNFTVAANGRRVFHRVISIRHPEPLCTALGKHVNGCMEIHNVNLWAKSMCLRVAAIMDIKDTKARVPIEIGCVHVPVLDEDAMELLQRMEAAGVEDNETSKIEEVAFNDLPGRYRQNQDAQSVTEQEIEI